MPNLPGVLPCTGASSASSSIGGRNIIKRTSVFGRADGKDVPVTSVFNAGKAKRPPSSSISDDHSDVKTSIFSRPDGSSTSINRPRGQERGAVEADDLRYGYVRRLIKERQAKEREEAKKNGIITAEGKPVIPSAQEKMRIKLGTGASFHRGLRGGLDKTLKKLVKTNRLAMKNISAADRKLLGDIISKHAANRVTGVGYGWGDKKRMKEETQKLFESNTISKNDAQDFKTIIDQLE